MAAGISTFTRFFPKMKARYDYGLLIFILTFCMVSLSGYRDDEIAKLAFSRILTILIGCFFTLFVSIFVKPVWAGTDLHYLVVAHIQSLAIFFQGTILFKPTLLLPFHNYFDFFFLIHTKLGTLVIIAIKPKVLLTNITQCKRISKYSKI